MITPPVTTITYVADGISNLFSIPFPYLSASFVKVFIDGVATPAFGFTSATQIRMDSLPLSDTRITVSRETSQLPLVSFNNSSSLSAEELNTATTQNLHIIQEYVANALSITVSATTVTDPLTVLYPSQGASIDISGLTHVVIQKRDASASEISISDTTIGHTIESLPFVTLRLQGESVHLLLDGTNWGRV